MGEAAGAGSSAMLVPVTAVTTRSIPSSFHSTRAPAEREEGSSSTGAAAEPPTRVTSSAATVNGFGPERTSAPATALPPGQAAGCSQAAALTCSPPPACGSKPPAAFPTAAQWLETATAFPPLAPALCPKPKPRLPWARQAEKDTSTRSTSLLTWKPSPRFALARQPRTRATVGVASFGPTPSSRSRRMPSVPLARASTRSRTSSDDHRSRAS